MAAAANIRVMSRIGGDAKIAERHVGREADIGDALDGPRDNRVFDLPHFSETGRQIVRAQQHGIDAGNLDDRLNVLHGLRVFGLYDHRDLIARPFQILLKSQPTIGL